VDEDISIITSKCSELNVVLPAKSDADDPVEIPIPEQFETKIRKGKLETTCVAHVGA
jgi:adenylyl cyclase-associated protein